MLDFFRTTVKDAVRFGLTMSVFYILLRMFWYLSYGDDLWRCLSGKSTMQLHFRL